MAPPRRASTKPSRDSARIGERSDLNSSDLWPKPQVLSLCYLERCCLLAVCVSHHWVALTSGWGEAEPGYCASMSVCRVVCCHCSSGPRLLLSAVWPQHIALTFKICRGSLCISQTPINLYPNTVCCWCMYDVCTILHCRFL